MATTSNVRIANTALARYMRIMETPYGISASGSNSPGCTAESIARAFMAIVMAAAPTKTLTPQMRSVRATFILLPNASVYDGGDKVSPGSPGQTAVRRTEWFGGGQSRRSLGDTSGVGGHTTQEETIRETVLGSYGNGGLAAWEVAEAHGPPVALRGPTVARGS